MSARSNKIQFRYKSTSCSDKEIIGLESFKSNLEKEFYSNITIRNSTICCEQNNLVIEMVCNLGLLEMLFHLQQGIWGTEECASPIFKGNPKISNQLQNIREVNKVFIDIEELSLILNDCSIVIKKIYPKSVELEFENIVRILADNYIFLSNQLTASPSEIFIPIFEEVSSTNDVTNMVGSKRISEDGYNSYWGIYLSMLTDPVIFDLKNKCLISGDVLLFNR